MSEDLNVGMKCVQYMVFVSNFLLVIVALLLISIGTTIKAIYTDFEFFLETSYFSPSTWAIIAGCIILVVAVFGCLGAIRESTLLINVYAFFLLVIFILELIVGITALTMRFDLSSTIEDNMQKAFDDMQNNTAELNATMDIFDYTQSQLSCCGVTGPNDWKYSNLTKHKLPKSCCSDYDYYSDNTNITCTYYYASSCAKSLSYVMSETSYLLSSGAICVALIQIIGIVFARQLSTTIRNIKTKRLVEAELRRQQIYSQIILGATLNGDNENCGNESTA